MILRELPDVPPRPKTPQNAAYRRWLYSRWGKEHTVVGARMRSGEIGLMKQPLSIKAVWGGQSETVLDGRRLRIDDDAFVVINEDRTYSSTWRMPDLGRAAARDEMNALCLFIRRGMPAEVYGEMLLTDEAALDAGAHPAARAVHFAERLRPHSPVIEPLLRQLHQEVRAGNNDEAWYAEQLQDLVEQLIRGEHRLACRGDRIQCVKASTRAELLRRVHWAADFMLSNYAEPITLDEVADAATLSKFHLVRLFRQVHQITPHAFLQRKRSQVAKRLIEVSDLSLNEIAVQAGFGSRSTMFRQLRRQYGASGLQLRHGERAERAA